MAVTTAFRIQAETCRRLGSQLYGRLLDRAVADLEAEGPTFRLIPGWPGEPIEDAVALRLMAGVHRLVLTGGAPDLAGHYPTAGGIPVWPGCGEAFLSVVAEHPEALARSMRLAPQTNEIGRSATLLGGLLEVGRMTHRPLRLLELGASAGLNLLFDRYRYELGGGTWGDPANPVVIRSQWRGSPPVTAGRLTIASRAGCDPHPVRLDRAADVASLRSYVWGDQTDRLADLDRAITLARADPPVVEAAPAEVWLPDRLAETTPGVTTVVWHSVLIQYLPAASRHRLLGIVRGAGSAATADAPLAWLRLEPGPTHLELRLSMWPSGTDLLLAEAHAHGSWTNWFVGAAPR